MPSKPIRDIQSLAPIVAELIETGTPTLPKAAKRLGVSPRSLQRLLGERGLKYSDLVDQTRRRLAEKHLRENGRSIAAIAAALGYRDPSSFSRAFQRWTGRSPRQYRREARMHGAGPSPHGDKARPNDMTR